MDFDLKKSGQIPAFGDWEYANDLPITQYFECARQAGLIRPNSSSLCHCPPCVAARGTHDSPSSPADDLYASDFEKHPIRVVSVPTRKTTLTKVENGNGGGGGGVKKSRKSTDFNKEQRKQVKVHDVKEQPRNQVLSGKQFPKQDHHDDDDGGTTQRPTTVAINVKPVDEDLYKIPSKLLHTSKRKKVLGFFYRCLTPPCNG